LELLLKDQAYPTLVQDEFLVAALGQALDSPSPRVRALGLSQVDKVSEEDLPVLRALVGVFFLLERGGGDILGAGKVGWLGCYVGR
jgi:hypothetical protein